MTIIPRVRICPLAIAMQTNAMTWALSSHGSRSFSWFFFFDLLLF